MSKVMFESKAAIIVCFVVIVNLCLCVCHAILPPDPDNAALLYYQAFLQVPEQDSEVAASLNNVLDGAAPDQTTRHYLDLCGDAFDYIEIASQRTNCHWGVMYSEGYATKQPQLQKIQHMIRLLKADIYVRASDRDYEGALNRCMTTYRFASHVGALGPRLSSVFSIGTERSALRSIQHVLGSELLEQETLLRLRSQLASAKGIPISYGNSLELDLAMALQSLRSMPDLIQLIRNNLENSADAVLTDEALVRLASEPYRQFLGAVYKIVDSERSYEQKYESISTLVVELKAGDWYESIGRVGIGDANLPLSLYGHLVRLHADLNATKAAIDIYLAVSKTGQVPASLPKYLPKDPFSGLDFEYEVVEAGFIIRCKEKDLHQCPLPLPRLGDEPSETYEIPEYFFVLKQN